MGFEFTDSWTWQWVLLLFSPVILVALASYEEEWRKMFKAIKRFLGDERVEYPKPEEGPRKSYPAPKPPR